MTMQIGPFEVLGVLGTGSSGVVYRARNTRLGRLVAIKQMHAPGGPEQEKALARFFREAQRMADVQSPNVVRLYSYQEVDGQPLIEMELVEGGSLDADVSAGPVPLPTVLRLAQEILSGLIAVHACGLLHRDIKPANILKATDGRFLLADFGLAGARTQLESMTAGTLQYAAPEQLRSAHEVDDRSDLYSAGMVCFEALLGREGMRQALRDAAGIDPSMETVQWMAWVADARRELPQLHHLNPQIPIEVSLWVARLTAKPPDRRFASARAALDALNELSSGQGAAPVSPAPEARSHATPGRPRVMVMAAAVVFSVIGAGVWVALHPRPRMAPPPKPPSQFAIRGRVHEVTGAALPGASVAVACEPARDGCPAAATGAQDSGDFAFDRISAGTYRLTARLAGFLDAQSTITVTDGNVTADIPLMREPPPAPEPPPPPTPRPAPKVVVDKKPDPVPRPVPAAVTPIRIDGSGLPMPKNRKYVAAEYPPGAKRDAAVTVNLVVSQVGTVSAVRIVASAPPFDAAAVAAVKQWEFEPTIVNGAAVPVILTVAIPFRAPR